MRQARVLREPLTKICNGVDRPHIKVMLNQPTNELGAGLCTPVRAGFTLFFLRVLVFVLELRLFRDG